jgi:hypothetical protein
MEGLVTVGGMGQELAGGRGWLFLRSDMTRQYLG